MTRLLVRDLAQVATPTAGTAPLRGGALRDVTVLEDAYVLCRDGIIERVGRMAELGAVGDDVEELDGT
ncbi:MAG: imidazolonepropionase, partial [Gaiellaceae bacterium]